MTTPDPAHALTPSGNLRRRLLVSRVLEGGATTAALLAVTVLGILIFYVTEQGVSALNWTFLTSNNLPPPLGTGAGMAPAIVGTFEIVAVATLIAAPVGVVTALYLTEFAGPRGSSVVRLFVDLMTGLPTVVIGVVIFGLIVEGSGDSGMAGSIALSIVMVPLITRATLEALSRVPAPMREAADALGVSRWRTVVGIVLPTAATGTLTATLLAVARAAGETAPLLFVDSLYGPHFQLNMFKAVPNIPLEIFTLSEAGTPGSYQRAWGAAFVLLAGILIANVTARTLAARSQRRMGG